MEWDKVEGETGMQRQNRILCKDQFIAKLVKDLIKEKRHFFLKTKQSQYLKNLKEVLSPTEMIIQMDFSQNLAFANPEAIAGFFWYNKQSTVHPFA